MSMSSLIVMIGLFLSKRLILWQASSWIGLLHFASMKGVSAHKCARISYVLNQDYQQDLGEHFRYADESEWGYDIPHKKGVTCSKHCESQSAIFSQQIVAISPSKAAGVEVPTNNSFSQIWAQYIKDPDPCHGEDGLCISWSFGQSEYGSCKCSLVISLMRVHKSGSRVVEGQPSATCSIDEVKARFEKRFPPNVYGYTYSKYWSQRHVHCGRKAGACDCTSLSSMHCWWDPRHADSLYERKMTR